MEVATIILASGTTVALIKVVERVIMWVLNRKAAKDDRKTGRKEDADGQRDQKIRDIQQKMDVLIESQKVNTRDRIAYLGRSYIKAGEVTFDDRDNLVDMHRLYHELGGNGHLDTIMAEVMKLPLKQ